MPIQACWELAQKWYKGRLERDWVRPDQEKTRQIFESLDLKGEFWHVG